MFYARRNSNRGLSRQILALVLTSVVMLQIALPAFCFESSNYRDSASVEQPDIQPSEEVKVRAREQYGNLPLSFEAIDGQTDRHVKFMARGAGYSLFLTRQAAVLSLRKNDIGAKDTNVTTAKGSILAPSDEIGRAHV